MIIHKLWRFLNNMCINLNVVTQGEGALSRTMRKEDEDKPIIKKAETEQNSSA